MPESEAVLGVNPRRIYLYAIMYVLVLHAAPFFNMLFGGIVPVFAVVDVAAVYSAWLMLRYMHRAATIGAGFTRLDLAISAYLLWSAASFLLYFQPGHPVRAVAYAEAVHHLLVPICLFFVMKGMTSEQRVSLVRWICLLNAWLIVVGSVLYFTRPAFFTDFLRAYYSGTPTESGALYGRMTSYLGSTMVGMVSAVTILLIPVARFGSVSGGIIVAIMVAGAGLAQQRGGFVGTMVALAYYLLSSHANIAKKTVTIVVGGLLIVGSTIWLQAHFAGLLSLVSHRFSGINEALGERMYSYRAAAAYFSDFPFGAGLGTTASAGGLNLRGEITDGNFARIFADLGLLGLFLFGLVIVLGIRRALLTRGNVGLAVLLVVYCVVAVGTNVFDIYYAGHLFWIVLGIIDSGPIARRISVRRWQPSPSGLIPESL